MRKTTSLIIALIITSPLIVLIIGSNDGIELSITSN